MLNLGQAGIASLKQAPKKGTLIYTLKDGKRVFYINKEKENILG